MKKTKTYTIRHYDHIHKQYILIDSDDERNLNFFDSSFNLVYTDTTYNIAAYRREYDLLNGKNGLNLSWKDIANLNTFYQFQDAQFFEDDLAVFSWAKFSHNGAGSSFAFFYDLKEKKLIKKISFEVPDDILKQFSCDFEILYFKPKDKFFYFATRPEISGYRIFECDGEGKIISELITDFVIPYPSLRFVYLDKAYFISRKYIMTIDGDNHIERIPLKAEIPPNSHFSGYFDYDRKLIVMDNAGYNKRYYTSDAPQSSYEIALDGTVTALPLLEGRFDKIIAHLAVKEAEERKKNPPPKPPKTEWDNYPKIRSAVYCMYPDEEKGVLYCVGGRVLMIDTNTGEKIGSIKSVSNPNQVLWNDGRTCLIVKSTAGEFAVFDYGKFDEPVWKFKVKRINNTDYDFTLYQNKLYGTATGGIDGQRYYKRPIIADTNVYRLYFIIDLEMRTVTNCTMEELEKGLIGYTKADNEKNGKIPEEYQSIQYVSCFYENDKFKFVGSWNNLMIVPKGQVKNKKNAVSALMDDCETYIRENGITKYMLENYGEEEIIHGGYFWALDSIEEKAKLGNAESTETEGILYSIGYLTEEIGNGGFEQYLSNGRPHDFELLIKSLKLIGAIKTAKIVEKAVKIQTAFDGGENHSDSDYEKLSAKIDDLQGELDADDYVELAVKYLRTLLK